MAEYIEREALKQSIRLMSRTTHPELVLYSSVQKVISNEPTADVVKVVRCKDCEYSRPLCHTEKKLYNDDCVGCTKISTSYHSVIVSENDFCSYGCAKMDGKGDNDG